MKNNKVFRSRISVLMTGSILALFIFNSIIMFEENRYEEIYISAGIFLLIILLFTGTRYVIAGDKLITKIAFIKTGSLNIKEITSIKRSYNPLSSPAASLKRLRIDFVKSRYWLISPVREKEFIEELKIINPHIRINIPEKKGIWRIQDWDI